MIRCFGFSLIELLVCFVLIALLATFSVPFWKQTQKKQLDLYLEKFVHYIHLAKTEAIKRNRIITLCGTENGKTCSTQWSNGLLILDQKSPIRTFKRHMPHAVHCQNQHAHAQLHFNALGKPVSPFATRFTCHADQQRVQLILSLTGRVRIQKN